MGFIEKGYLIKEVKEVGIEFCGVLKGIFRQREQLIELFVIFKVKKVVSIKCSWSGVCKGESNRIGRNCKIRIFVDLKGI